LTSTSETQSPSESAFSCGGNEQRRPVTSLQSNKPLTGPTSPRRSVRAPGDDRLISPQTAFLWESHNEIPFWCEQPRVRFRGNAKGSVTESRGMTPSHSSPSHSSPCESWSGINGGP